jgi:phosphoribosylglycinamide formyltransferase-1
MNKRYSFYCSGGTSRLIKFYETHDLFDYKVEFVLYDDKRADVIVKLRKYFGKKLVIFNSKDKLSDVLYSLMKAHKVDYMFCFGNKILKGDLITKYRNRIVNFHPSLLPSFPGLNSIDQALNSSVQILGNTAHFIDEGIDTGPIIMQSVISRSAYNEYEDVLSLQIDMLEKIWHLLDNDSIKVNQNKVQIHSLPNRQNFFSV